MADINAHTYGSIEEGDIIGDRGMTAPKFRVLDIEVDEPESFLETTSYRFKCEAVKAPLDRHEVGERVTLDENDVDGWYFGEEVDA